MVTKRSDLCHSLWSQKSQTTVPAWSERRFIVTILYSNSMLTGRGHRSEVAKSTLVCSVG